MKFNVSIIIPFYNSENTIRRCVESVISQSHRNIQIILINNNSIDRSMEIISSIVDPRIEIIQESRQGVSNARNAGLARAQGEFIAFLDSDDYWISKFKIESQLNAFQKNQNLVLCSTGAQFKSFNWSKINLNKYILYDNYIITSSVMVKKEALELLPNPIFNSFMYFAEDWAIWIKLSIVGELCYLDDKFTYYELPSVGKYDSLKILSGYTSAFTDAILFSKKEGYYIDLNACQLSLRLAVLKSLFLTKLLSKVIYRFIRYAHQLS